MTEAEKSNLLEAVKLALRIKTMAFNDQLSDLIGAAIIDLKIAGVTPEVEEDVSAIVRQAVVTYCRMHFGEPDEYDRLKMSYDEQKAQLQTATGYTDWGLADGQI